MLTTESAASDLKIHLSDLSDAEGWLGSRQLRDRAKRYRRLAEILLDEAIIAIVLQCARELEEAAETQDNNYW
jgi:hypothetical protein